MQIINGDSLEVLKTLEENSVDSIVTDPPYGLSFMGKKWDYDVPSTELWKEAIRVLKPGGHLISFAGSRTYHRMAVNIEDAGFEIRDQIMWVYGCLSEDTEVLTSNGWERFHKDTKYGKIMVYDIQKDIYKWEEPEGWQSYQINKDTAYRIQSDYTDQIVSRNHRCLVEREGKLTFVQAEELSEMELMPTLSNDFYRVHKLQSKVLLKTMQRVLSWAGLEEVGKDRERNSKPTRTQSKEGSLGCGQSCVERGSNLFQEKGKLRKIQNKVFTLSERILSYGKERQLCYGTQTDSGSISQSLLGKSRGSSSHQPQPRGQSVGESDVVSVKQGSQVTRMARVTKIEYTGLIFCPTVSTGAFVARRNGKIFVTGNSGFPKSHNIGKAVDKLQGNEREVTGERNVPDIRGDAYGTMNDKQGGSYNSLTIQDTKGTSPYEGWGTALKPAHEPIVVARKPLSESTIAENVLKWGTGGINIDASRVGTEPIHINGGGGGKGTGWGKKEEINEERTGRFPANFIHDGSDEVVGLFPYSTSGARKTGSGTFGGFVGNGKKVTSPGVEKSEGNASRFFKTCSPTLEYDTMSVCKHTNANNVELALITIRATIGNIAPLNVEDWLDERLVQNVKSVGIECQRCATSIAQELAKIRSLVFKNEELLATQDFIGNFKNSTPILNLASIVAIWENIGTTPTTQNLSQLFGSVLLAIDENTSLDTKEKAEQKSEHASFAYFPKASKKDRNDGLEGFVNSHPTIKPTSLMQYLVRLVTPKGGIVLDPFMGSGSTGKACKLEGFDFIGIELDPEYCKIAEARINAKHPQLRECLVFAGSDDGN